MNIEYPVQLIVLNTLFYWKYVNYVSCKNLFVYHHSRTRVDESRMEAFDDGSNKRAENGVFSSSRIFIRAELGSAGMKMMNVVTVQGTVQGSGVALMKFNIFVRGLVALTHERVLLA